MCFSAPVSLGFALMGAVTTTVLLWKGRSVKYVGVTAYFTVMEVRLQVCSIQPEQWANICCLVGVPRSLVTSECCFSTGAAVSDNALCEAQRLWSAP
jgi:hypothetical protein